jgi:hypothetical protein
VGAGVKLCLCRTLGYETGMRPVLKTNNPVTLSYASHVLDEAGIECVVFDENASIMDGSMGAVPRRLMVLDEDFAKAERVLLEAIPDEFP